VIEALRIEGLAVVDRAEIELGPGLNVLTGETGAGKSIALGAVELLAGGRASTDLVREGSEEAVVEAIFRSDHHPELEAELEQRGFAVEQHELVVRRPLARRLGAGGRLIADNLQRGRGRVTLTIATLAALHMASVASTRPM